MCCEKFNQRHFYMTIDSIDDICEDIASEYFQRD